MTESCGVILAALQWVLRRRYQHNETLFVGDGVRMLVLFVALFAAEYGRYVLVPAYAKIPSASVYGALVGLGILQAVLLIGYVAITGWLQTPVRATGIPVVVNGGRPAGPATARPITPTPARRQKR